MRLRAVILAALLAAMLIVPARGDDSRAYVFRLSIDGKDVRTAAAGDVLTVTLALNRTLGDGAMYAMQDELLYDPAFFELIPGSIMVREGVETAQLTLRDGQCALYMNFLSLSGNAEWADAVNVGVFQLRVLASSGASAIRSSAYAVSNAEGTESCAVTAEDVTVVVSEECRVTFRANGGSTIEPRLVLRGTPLAAPEEPVRAGYVFSGWYKDFDLTQPWDMQRDTVETDMTLYAAWTALPQKTGGAWWLAAAMAMAAAAGISRILRSRRKQT